MDNLKPNERSLWTHWNSKTPREVAREAAAKGEPALSLALRHLEHRLAWDATTTSKWFRTEVNLDLFNLYVYYLCGIIHLLMSFRYIPGYCSF